MMETNSVEKKRRLFNPARMRNYLTSVMNNTEEDQGNLRRGLTLVELAIVLLVLGIIMSIVFANLDFSTIDKAKKLQLTADAKMLPFKIMAFEEQNEPLEDGASLAILAQSNPENTSYQPLEEKQVKDPWGYFYYTKQDESGKTHICTNGKDGQLGGDNINTDFCITDPSNYPEWMRSKKRANQNQ